MGENSWSRGDEWGNRDHINTGTNRNGNFHETEQWDFPGTVRHGQETQNDNHFEHQTYVGQYHYSLESNDQGLNSHLTVPGDGAVSHYNAHAASEGTWFWS